MSRKVIQKVHLVAINNLGNIDQLMLEVFNYHPFSIHYLDFHKRS